MKKQKRTKKSAERNKQTKLPSECQQETNEKKKKIKSSQASKREQNRFCKKRLLSHFKMIKTKN